MFDNHLRALSLLNLFFEKGDPWLIDTENQVNMANSVRIVPCIDMFSALLCPVATSLLLSCFKIFAITEAYFGASDKDRTTE